MSKLQPDFQRLGFLRDPDSRFDDLESNTAKDKIMKDIIDGPVELSRVKFGVHHIFMKPDLILSLKPYCGVIIFF